MHTESVSACPQFTTAELLTAIKQDFQEIKDSLIDVLRLCVLSCIRCHSSAGISGGGGRFEISSGLSSLGAAPSPVASKDHGAHTHRASCRHDKALSSWCLLHHRRSQC